MKKLSLILLSLTIILSMAACTGNTTPSGTVTGSGNTTTGSVSGSKTGSSNTDSTASSGASSQASQNQETVDIILPAIMFQGLENIDVKAYAKENGYIKAVMNKDGTMTVTMTKAKQKELMTSLKTTMEATLAEMIESATSPYVKDITYNDDFSIVTVDVDRAAFEAATIDMTPFMIGMYVVSYQAIAGLEQHTEVTIRDAASKEVISTDIYPDAFNPTAG